MCREKGTNVPRKGNDKFQKIGDFWRHYAIFSKNFISIRLYKSYMRVRPFKGGARSKKERNQIAVTLCQFKNKKNSPKIYLLKGVSLKEKNEKF